MPESATAENLEGVEKEPEQPLEQEIASDIEKKLTKNELQSVKEKKTTIPKILQQREQYKAAAKAELNRLVTVTTEGGNNLIDLKEYKKYNNEIEETESAEKMANLLDEIKEIPRQKQNEEQNEKEETRELSPEDPELLTLQRKFDKVCDQNKDLIGLKQIPGFKAWFAEERKSNPNIKHLNEQIKKLEGKEITDRNGLAPRKEEFTNLQNLFKKHGINSPLKSEWIKSEGLSERIQFRKNAEEMEDILRKLKGTGFYSNEIIKKTMQEILLADSPETQKRKIQLTKNVARIEAQSFTHLDSKINIGGITIRKMSQKGKDQLIDYYKTLSLSEREENVKKWPDFIQTEADLALELEELYGENKETLKLALGSFEELNFEEKQKALKEHKKILEKSENEEQLQKALTIKASHAKIDEAARNNILAKSTQRKYKEWFEDENNFRDPKTKKPGNLDELKNAYSILISPTPDKEAKNLSAYQIKRMRFQKEVDELTNINPDIKKSRLKKW
ncbi:hypothetical protein GF366_03865, partial [Candidatus Peregrinibacteria bacterium]|nr:hypothetical protein [Candidatus Peregrinibacteria bacterium]